MVRTKEGRRQIELVGRESIPVIGTQIPGKREFEISFPGMTGLTPGSHSDHEETC